MVQINKLSFVYLTIREGYLDVLSNELKAQKDPRPWELIVVDGFPGRVERGNGEKLLLHFGIPLADYIKPKPKTFPWSRINFANAINTGALHASGDFVVYLHDYTMYPEDMVSMWYNILSETDGKTLVHGIAKEHETTAPDMLNDLQTWSKPPELKYRGDWVPSPFELGYFAFPIKFLEECNGLDERADFCFNFSTRATIAHARALGYSLKVDHRLVCGTIDHHKWESAKDKNNYTVGSHWRIPGEYSDVPEIPEFTGWAANPYVFKKERQKILAQKQVPVRTGENHYFLAESATIK